MNYNWGFGLELERLIFYKKKNEYIAVDIELLLSLTNKTNLLDEELNLLNSLPALEIPGKKCVLSIKSKMIEIVTKFPLNNNVESIINQLESDSTNLLQIFNKIYNQHINKHKLIYSEISTLKYRDIDGKLKFSNTGSLHINITLPYNKKCTDDQFLLFYKNYINQFYWIEPILYAIVTSGHYKSLKYKDYVKCCYRMSIGWGVAGGSNLNRLEKGQPRMSTKEPNYLKKMTFKKTINPNNKSCIGTRNKYNSYDHSINLSPYFTNIATIYKKNPFWFAKPILSKQFYEKIYIRKFKKGYGIEFRLFDEYQPNKIIDIIRLLIYLAENTKKYNYKKMDLAYDNQIWNDAIISILHQGYKTKFNNDYINLVKQHLHLNSTFIKKDAISVLNTICSELYTKYNNKLYSRLMLSNKYDKPPSIFNMNKQFIKYFSK